MRQKAAQCTICTVLCVLALTACARPFALKAIDSAQVPETLLSALPETAVPRACFSQGDRAAACWTIESVVQGYQCLSWGVASFSEGDGTHFKDGSGSIVLDIQQPGVTGHFDFDQNSRVGDKPFISICGIAFNSSARSVEVTTTADRVFIGVVTNGFWWIWVDAPAPGEYPQVAVIKDAKGRQIHALDLLDGKD